MYMIPDKELLVAFTGALDPPEKGDEILGGLVRMLLES